MRSLFGCISSRSSGVFLSLCFALLVGAGVLFFVPGGSDAQVTPLSGGDGFESAVRIQTEYFQYQYADSDTVADAKYRIRRTLDLAKAAGVDTVDLPVAWAGVDLGDSSGVSANRGRYIWEDGVGSPQGNHLDFTLREIEARGMNAAITIGQSPDWIHAGLKSSVPDYGSRQWYPPRGNTQLDLYSDFVGDLAAHIESEYPGLVDHYQTWNEPNNPAFWRPSPGTADEGPREYIALQRAGYLALKAVDEDIEVSTAGISLNNYGYLDAYYDAARSYPYAHENDYFFDTLAVHPYVNPYDPDLAPTAYEPEYSAGSFYYPEADYTYIGATDGNFTGFEKMYETMVAREGESGKSVFLGEFGYDSPKSVTDAVRAEYLKEAYEIARQYPYIKGMSWYTFQMNTAHGAGDVRCPVGSGSLGWTMLGRCYEQSATYDALVSANSTSATITDDDSPGFAVSGSWTRTTSPDGRYLKSTRLSSATVSKGTAVWRFAPPQGGSYRVYARWPSGDYDTSARYSVQRADGTWVLARTVDQSRNEDRWVYLGQFNLDAVYEGKVRLSDDASGGTKRLAADAVKIEPAG